MASQGGRARWKGIPKRKRSRIMKQVRKARTERQEVQKALDVLARARA